MDIVVPCHCWSKWLWTVPWNNTNLLPYTCLGQRFERTFWSNTKCLQDSPALWCLSRRNGYCGCFPHFQFLEVSWIAYALSFTFKDQNDCLGLSFLIDLKCIYLFIFVVWARCMYVNMGVPWHMHGNRGQACEVASLILPLWGFLELSSSCQASGSAEWAETSCWHRVCFSHVTVIFLSLLSFRSSYDYVETAGYSQDNFLILYEVFIS